MMLSKVFGKRKAKANAKVKRKASAKAKRKASAKAKRKEKPTISRRKENQTRRTRNAPSARETIVPSSLTWPAEKKTMSHELCKMTMIDNDASVHVCPPKHGQGHGLSQIE